MTKLAVTKPISEAERIEPEDDRPKVGSWWWVRSNRDNDNEEEPSVPSSLDDASDPKADYDKPGRLWLGCVTEVGSNYAKFRGVRWSTRMAIDDMPKRCVAEVNPQAFIDSKISIHRTKVRELMGEIQRVCHQLGVPLHQALAEAEAPSTALAIAHGTADVNRYQKALVKAKDKTLPELFEKVREQHKAMATWMNAELIPAEAELDRVKGITDVIQNKIHTVELYAGLTEKMVCVREGEAADASAKVHLMQRMHYMDEECLARYEAGGMDFENLADFDKWIARDENMARLLPHERCIVAFKIRRYSKDYGIGDSLEKFIRFQFHNEYNKKTFLFIRNGRQLWRMSTSIEFSSEMFPNKEDSDVLGDDELWIKEDEYSISHAEYGGVITARRRNGMIDSWKSLRSYCAQVLWQWHRLGCPGGKPKGKPREKTDGWTYVAIDHEHEKYNWKAGEAHQQPHGDPRQFPFGMIDNELQSCHSPAWRQYVRLTPESIYYDDVMKHIAEVAFEHNRLAVVIQGLLDRSTCLHPHPPWRIWTPEGFAAGIELVYDVSRALTPGEAPDWEGYRAQLNKSIRPGCYTIGQRPVWSAEMEKTWGEKWHYHGSVGEGPDRIDQVAALKRTGKALFKFTRRRQKAKYVPSDRAGWLTPTYPEIDMQWWCSVEHLTCIDAYTPGDYRMFFDDPRTRALYIKWAPILLSAEDWHHERRTASDENATPKKRKRKR